MPGIIQGTAVSASLTAVMVNRLAADGQQSFVGWGFVEARAYRGRQVFLFFFLFFPVFRMALADPQIPHGSHEQGAFS